MAITVGGIGSGLDVNGIISQLMDLERQPLVALQQKAVDYGVELSAYGKIKSALSTFETAVETLKNTDTFTRFSATSSDTNAFTASADDTAVGSTYGVEVLRLAQADKKYATGNYSGETGTFRLTSGSESFDIVVGSTNNTLADIRDAINNSENNTTVSAAIINDGSDKLVLTSRSTGEANAITATDLSGTVAATLNFDKVPDLIGVNLDASVNVDGFTISSATNTVTGAISGVTLTLKQVTSTAQSLTVARDTSAITTDIETFIDGYNALYGTLRELGGETGNLSGDSALLSIERGLQGVLNSAASGLPVRYLSDIGISKGVDGRLSLDNTTLDSAMSDNLNNVINLFSDENAGFATRLAAVLDGYTNAETGLIKNREDGVYARLDTLEERQDALTLRLESIEKRFRAQFTALDTLMSQMQSTGNFLTQQLASLPGPAPG